MISQLKQFGLVGLLIICVTVTPAFAIDDRNRNLFLIYVMSLTPFLLLRYNSMKRGIDAPLFVLGSLMLLLPIMFHSDTFRVSTVMFSWLYFMYFATFTRVLRASHFSVDEYANLLKYLIYAYFIVLVIQQVCVLTGLPIFNKAAYNPIEPWKLNSLAPEPSITARIITLMLFLYIQLICRKYQNLTLRNVLVLLDRKVIYCYLYCIVTMGSSTGFFFLVLILFQFLPKKNIVSIFLASATILCSLYLMFRDIPSFQRSLRFVVNLINYNEDSLIQEDLSAAIRIVPTVHGFNAIDLLSFDSLFGHGIDADEGLTPLPSVDCGAGSFSMWYNYGFIASLIFWIFSYKVCSIQNAKITSFFIWFLLIFFYGGINNPVIWMTMIMMYTYNNIQLDMRTK